MDAVEDIKQRLSIEDVISQYVELKRAGRNFKGLSPFSNEKTPSFMVSPEKQIWHDFSSGKGGNMFSFVMEMEGLDFKGALELLARQAGIDLSQYQNQRSGARGQQKERLLEALELTAKFYQVHFSKNKTALEYVLKTRGYSKDTALAFRLGYSPNQDDALTKFLKQKGFSEQELKRAGLSVQRYRGPGDMFRGRLMVPLMDPVGKVIGFTARLLVDEPNAPKYINTPQTPVYDKSRHVFGLHLAKEAIRKSKTAVVVEGNLDVIASYQAGVRQVVATAGTALTEQHLKVLSRLTHDIRLAFDQDQAGLTATERAIPIAGKVGVNLSMVTIPSGKDPDELIKKDPKLWQQAIEQPTYAVDWIIERYQQLLNTETAQGKREFTDRVLAVVRNLSDQVEQDHYLQQIAKQIGVSADALRDKMKSNKTAPQTLRKRRITEQPKLDPAAVDLIKSQNQLLALVFMLPSLRTYLEPVTPDMLPEEPAQTVLSFLKANLDFNGGKTAPAPLKVVADYVKMLSVIYEELYQDLEVLELRYEAARLQVRLIEHYVKTQKAKLAQDMANANEQQTNTLLEQAKALDILLRSQKGGMDGR